MHGGRATRSSIVTSSLISYAACTTSFVFLWFCLIKFNTNACGFDDNFVFGNFVQRLEIINITIASSSSSHVRNQLHSFWIVTFNALRRRFELVLFSRSNILLLPGGEIVLSHQHKQDRWQIEEDFFLVEGKVKGENNSVVRGNFDKNTFRGVIIVWQQKYFVDKIGNSSVIYQELDGEQKIERCRRSSPLDSGRHFLKRSKSKKIPIRRIKRAKESPSFVCSLKLFADHTFYLYSNDRTARGTIGAMLRILDDVNSIFSNTDFNLDGKKGEFQFVVRAIHIFADQDAMNYQFNDENLTSEELLQKLTYYNLDEFCLGIAFVYRSFPDRATGIGYPYVNDPMVLGGICDWRVSPFREKYKERSFNVIVISIRFPNGEIIPHDMNVVNLAHQLGHSMGSEHDDPEIPRCYPSERKGGPFIMSKVAPVEKRRNYFRFSPCSRRAIHGTLLANAECLKAKTETVCGNGIREQDEECDCGDENQCRLIDSCCQPKNNERPLGQCTLRRNEGAMCSSREDFCCTDNCQFVSAYARKDCTRGNECLEPSICLGNMSQCPEARQKRDGILCKQGLGECFKGVCLDVYCYKNNMTECECNDIRDTCKVCCEKNGLCQPAQFWRLKNVLRMDGESCQQGRGLCEKGTCRLHGPAPPPVYLSERTESLFPTYMIVMMSLVGTVVILLAVLIAVWTCARFIMVVH